MQEIGNSDLAYHVSYHVLDRVIVLYSPKPLETEITLSTRVTLPH